jgi:hypothetical protein
MMTNDQLTKIYELAASGRYWRTTPTKRSELVRAISLETEIGENAIQNFLDKKTYANFWDKMATAGSLTGGLKKIEKAKAGKYIITAAQNNSAVHAGFLANLITYADHLGAELLIAGFTYNKGGFKSVTKNDQDVWFASDLARYLVDCQIRLAPSLVLCAELDVTPTAEYPLSGFERYTEGSSLILGHTKQQLTSCAVLKGQRAKMLYSTGTVTLKNYIQRKAGQKAETGHTFGALVVEVDQLGRWFVRQIQAEPETGRFYDLTCAVEGGEVMPVDQHIVAINWGDHHAEKRDSAVLKVCADMRKTLQPHINVMHDVLDFSPRNHHNVKDPHWMFEQWAKGTDKVLDAFAAVGEVLTDFMPALVVESNHDLAADRWLKEQCFKTDPANALTFLELTAIKYRKILAGEDCNVLEEGLRLAGFEFDDHEVAFMRVDDSWRICEGSPICPNGVELGIHGHTGANGAKGTPKQFQKLGQAMNTGHTHSASIYGAVFTAGVTGALDMGYNVGASSWSHSHVVTYDNGARTIVTFWGDSWRA